MKIPAQIHETFCPACGYRIEFPLFLSSFYAFATYQEIESTKIVRIDLEGVKHQKISIGDVLQNYSKMSLRNFENAKWINLYESRFCPKCVKILTSKECKGTRFCLEEEIDADTIP